MVRLHEVYEDAQNVYIVMENCKGSDLEALLEVSPCPVLAIDLEQISRLVIVTCLRLIPLWMH